jgi:hypothetical protein
VRVGGNAKQSHAKTLRPKVQVQKAVLKNSPAETQRREGKGKTGERPDRVKKMLASVKG